MNSPGRYLVPLSLLGLLVYFLFKVHQVLLPFVLGGVLAYFLSPLVRIFEVRGLRRQPMVLIIFGALLAMLSWGTWAGIMVASQEASMAATQLPRYVQRGQQFLKDFRDWEEQKAASGSLPFALTRRLTGGASPMDLISSHWRTLPAVIAQQTPSFASHLVPFVELFLLVPFIAFMILLEGPAMMERLLGTVSSRHVEMLLNIIVEIDNSLGNYLRGVCLKSFLTGLSALAGYWVIGLDYAVQLGMLTMFTNVIPMVGPWIAIAVACLVAVFQWGTVPGILKVIGVSLIVRMLDDGVLQLVVMNSVDLHPLAVLFALMAGGTIWGFWGLLFAIPLACTAKVLLQVIWQWYRSEYGLAPADPAPEVSHIPLI